MDTVTIHNLPVAEQFDGNTEIAIATFRGADRETAKMTVDSLSSYINATSSLKQEHGVWTPTVKFYKTVDGNDIEFTPVGAYITYGGCEYTKIGRLVAVSFSGINIDLGSTPLPAEFSHYEITGLPYGITDTAGGKVIFGLNLDLSSMLFGISSGKLTDVFQGATLLQPKVWSYVPTSFTIRVTAVNLSTGAQIQAINPFMLGSIALYGSMFYRSTY